MYIFVPVTQLKRLLKKRSTPHWWPRPSHPSLATPYAYNWRYAATDRFRRSHEIVSCTVAIFSIESMQELNLASSAKSVESYCLWVFWSTFPTFVG